MFLEIKFVKNSKYVYHMFSFLKIMITMKGLDTVESLSAEASANLSVNRNHLISITVKWYQSDCWADSRVFVCKS